jgi:hypothetical protein
MGRLNVAAAKPLILLQSQHDMAELGTAWDEAGLDSDGRVGKLVCQDGEDAHAIGELWRDEQLGMLVA